MSIKTVSIIGIQLIGSFFIMTAPFISSEIHADTIKVDSGADYQKSAPVTVKYVDQEGNEFLTSQTFTGNVGDNINFTPKMHDDMKLISVEGTPQGKYTTEPQQIVYHFKRIPIVVPVEYMDDNGHPLTNDSGSPIKQNQTYSFTGYNFDLLPEDLFNVPGWQLDLDKSMYGDSSVNQLISFNQLISMTGIESVNEVPKILNDQWRTFIVDDYHTYLTPEPIIKAVYTRIPKTTGSVTVKYVDSEGNSINGSQMNTGIKGSQYSITPRNIDGYKLLKVIGSSTGNYSDTDRTIEYVYEKQPMDVKKETSTLSNSTGQINNTVKKTNQQSVGQKSVPATASNANGIDHSGSLLDKQAISHRTITAAVSQKELPDTGQSNSVAITVTGILLTITGSIIYLFRAEFSKE